MSIRLDFHAEGMETVNNLMHYLSELGAKPRGVNLMAHNRLDGDETNAQLLRWHAHLEGSNHPYPKRDFVTNSAADNEDIARVSAQRLEKDIQGFIRQQQKWERLKARSVAGQYTTKTGRVKKLGAPPDKAKKANAWAANMLAKAAMPTYMKQVHDRIEREFSNTGDVPPLSEDYAQKKQSAKGFIDIMKWTGQILDNLDFSGVGGKNIKVTKE